MTRVYWMIALALGALGSYDIAHSDLRGAAGAFGVTVLVALAIAERLIGDDQ